MKPSARTLGKLPGIDLSEIQPGEYRVFKEHVFPDHHGGKSWGVLVVRRNNGEFNLWNVMLSGDKVAMPDVHWWRSYQECDSFGPTTSHGLVVEDKPITCHDLSGISEWSRREWRWSLSGKNLGESTDDLLRTKGVIKNEVFIFSYEQ